MGLLSRVNRSIKRGEISFSYSERGSRYIHVEKLKEWAADYLDRFTLIEDQEQKKLEVLDKTNKDMLVRLNIENETALLAKAEKHLNEKEAKRQAAKKSNEKKRAAKEHCIREASDLWSKSYEDIENIYKVKEMCELLMQDLGYYPGLFQPKSLDTIRTWLKDAERKGNLIIPDAAKRGGRPKKT